MTRERHVFPTGEIPHKWAHQTQADARNSRGNLFFEGPTIYSYRTSYPLARIYTKGKGAKIARMVLTNSRSYSSTTAGHQSAVNDACSHLPCIAVPCLSKNQTSYLNKGDWHVQNIQYLIETAAGLLTKSQRSLRSSIVRWRFEQANSLGLALTNYKAFFGVRTKTAPFDAEGWDKALARVKAIENPDPVHDAKRFKARAAREEARTLRVEKRKAEYAILQAQARFECAEDLEAWRNGGNVPYRVFRFPEDWTRADMRAVGVRYSSSYTSDGSCMLRVKDNQIETSKGACIPLDHAPRIWRLVQACIASGREYRHNGHTEYAGDYRIDSVSATGELRAGCHAISFEEIQRLAIALKLA